MLKFELHTSCDLMLFDNVFQYGAKIGSSGYGCDLMLFDNVFQFRRFAIRSSRCCDLMLFDNVFQSPAEGERAGGVVI